ncbi:MAG: hypothetical protein WC917_02965 [Bacilli bacterium]|jgi:hypothetical protein
MKHKEKVKLFKSMSVTKKEKKRGVKLFDSAEWDRRKESKKDKQFNQGKKNK